MATKQARDLNPGDIVDGRRIRDGAARMTVARIFPAFGGRMTGVEWSSGQVSHLRPHDVLTVHHVNTIGGAL